MRFTSSIILPVFFLVTLCVGEEAPHSREALQPIACEFETITENTRDELSLKKRAWRLWRADNTVETQELGSPDAEAWQRNPSGHVTYYRVFHPEKRAIEYKPIDLSIAHNAPDWDRLTSVIDPQLVAKGLKQTGEERFLGRAAVRYNGEANGSRFEVLWLTHEQIPAFVRETRDGGHVSTIELREIHSLVDSPWHFGNKDEYEIIDFADLGDKESDPVLQAMLRRGGHARHQH